MRNDLLDYYKQYYKNHSDGYYAMEGCKNTSRVLTLMDWLKKYVKPGASVLDVGCGDGYLASQLTNYNWHGIDINLEKYKGEKSKAINRDLMDTPYPFQVKQFDAVVCSEVLEHVWDIRVVNKEIKRLLKPGGVYLVSTPNHDWIDMLLGHYRQLLFDPNMPHLFEHIRFYNLDSHKRFLNEAGFEVLEHTGADEHYSGILGAAGKVLAEEATITPAKAGQIIGKMFPSTSHTIMLVGRSI